MGERRERNILAAKTGGIYLGAMVTTGATVSKEAGLLLGVGFAADATKDLIGNRLNERRDAAARSKAELEEIKTREQGRWPPTIPDADPVTRDSTWWVQPPPPIPDRKEPTALAKRALGLNDPSRRHR